MNTAFLRTALCTFSLALGASSARADVIVVGPGHVPSTIQPAIDAAQDDDVILVKDGTYPSFVVRKKSLTIVAEKGANPRIRGAIRVGGVSATRTVVISGFQTIGAMPLTPSNYQSLRVSNCSGLVLVQDCKLGGTGATSAPASEKASVLIENSQSVVLSHCDVAGTGSFFDAQGEAIVGGDGIELRGSVAAFFETNVVGGLGGYGYGGAASGFDGTTGGSGVLATNSMFFTSGSSLRGGQGGFGYASTVQGGDSGDGGIAVKLQSSVWYRRDTTNTGGPAGVMVLASLPTFASSAYHVGSVGAPLAMDASSSAPIRAGVAGKLVLPALAREGESPDAVFSGGASDAITRLTSRAGVSLFDGLIGTQVPAFGPSFRSSYLGTTGPPSAPQLGVTMPILDLGAATSRVLFVQGRHVDTTGNVVLGTPRALVMLDSSF